MAEFLKEKVKRYIKENYGKCSIIDVANKFNVSQTSVEEYIIDELYAEEKEREKGSAPIMQNSYLKWSNRTLAALILIAVSSLIFTLTISQLSNNDLWQHLKNGQMILQTHKFQYADPYSCNAVGNPWINEAWFSGVVFYIVYSLVGVNGIIFLKTFVILLMTSLVLLNCYKLETKFILFVPLAVFMIFNVGVRFLARTEMFSYIFVAAFFLILMQYKYRHADHRILFLLPIIQIFWSNMHGSFIVGIFILVIFVGCETARLIFNRYVSFWQRDLLTWKRLKPLFTIFVITFLATLINPYGFRLFIQPFSVVIHKSDYIKTIYEWQSPFASRTFFTSYAFKYYIVWMVLLLLSFLVNLKRFDLSNFVLSAFFFVMAAQMHRNITIFTIATCPIVALNFQQAGKDFIHIKDQKLKQMIYAGVGVIMLIILIPLIMVSKKHGYIYRKGSSKPFGLGVASNMPIEATEYIMANHIKGCCFNSYTYGTYLIFHCFPDVRVTMDSRAEHVYGEKFYKRHQIALYDVRTFIGILEEFNIEFILLKYKSTNQTKNCEYLQKSEKWALVYFDDDCFLYLRRLPEYEALIARDEYKHIHPILTMQQERIPKNEMENYIAESERNLTYNPKYPFPRVILLNLYAAKGDWDKAAEHGEFLIKRKHANYTTYLVMGMVYIKSGALEKARDMYQRALAINPGSEEAKRALESLKRTSNI